MPYAFALIAAVVGLMLGLVFPDIDGSLARTPFAPLIQHRSLLTHSFLIPLVLYSLARRHRDPLLRLFTMGFSIAMATHLCFDLFPWTWRGTALIYAPLVGRLDPTVSILWIVASIGVCLGLAFALIRRQPEVMLVIGALALTYALAASRERTFWLPLLVLVGLGIVAWVLTFTPLHEQDPALRDRL